MQLSIFDILYEKFKIDKPIRLIEFFAGIGSQAKALKNLKIPFEHHAICEWAYPSILAYNEIHHKELKYYGIDFSAEQTKDFLIKVLYEFGISSNYNEPMTLEQIKRLPEQKIRQIFNAIMSTNNLVNIQNVKGQYLNINDKEHYIYLLTYSFPCQDLNLAGLGKGMSRDGGTRSGMLWEVERILDECKELDQLPQILLMENVPQVIGVNAIKDFQEWRNKLESLGYSNYVECLNAKDYEIPQNRERCFMISILGEYNYTFPQKKQLKLKLKDMLEDNVDEKYYLSDKMISGMLNTSFESYKLENKLLDKDGISHTIVARFDGCPQCVEDNNIKMPEATKKGYAEAYEGDGVYINRPHQKRGVVQKQMIQTLKTQPDVGVVVKDEIDVIGNYSPSKEKGHRLAKSISNLNTIEELEEELREVNQTANEILSRIKILKGKLKPLIAWTKVAEKKMGEMSNVKDDKERQD